MDTISDIVYEMVTLDDAGNLYRRELSLPLSYPPAHWVLDDADEQAELLRNEENAKREYRAAIENGRDASKHAILRGCWFVL